MGNLLTKKFMALGGDYEQRNYSWESIQFSIGHAEPRLGRIVLARCRAGEGVFCMSGFGKMNIW